MTLLEQAVVGIAQILESLRIDYMLVGGIANAAWGEPRATLDVDVTISVDPDRIPSTIESLERSYRSAVPDPVRFVRDTRVLPLDTPDGVRIDLIFALLSFELEALRRATTVQFANRDVRVITPEDLILMKIISERPRDLADAEAISRRRLNALDRDYLDPRIREFATALERPTILTKWLEWTDRS
jgi:hypothetical protein